MKLLVIGLLILIVAGCFVLIYFTQTSEDKKQLQEEINELYQGPVPLGFDEVKFRLTGKTIPLVKVSNG